MREKGKNKVSRSHSASPAKREQSFLERRPSSVLGTSPSPPTLSSQASPPATPSNNSEIKTLFDNALNKREGWSLSVNSLNTMATKGNDLAKLAVVLLYRVGTAGLEIDETTAASYLSAGLSVLSSFQGKGICDYWDGLPILQQLRA